MNDTTKAQLFRAAQRNGIETESWRSLHCFDQQAQRCSGMLRAVTEHTLAGGASVCVYIKQDTLLLLLPTVGAIVCTDTQGWKSSISAGQACLCFLPEGAYVTLYNPFADHLVNVLQFFLHPAPGSRPKHGIYNFDLEANPDALVKVLSYNSRCALPVLDAYTLRIGKFAGRSEAACHLGHVAQRLFVYVIEGAFEVQCRLMEQGDGLMLWNSTEIKLEALSNEAVILLLELPG